MYYVYVLFPKVHTFMVFVDTKHGVVKILLAIGEMMREKTKRFVVKCLTSEDKSDIRVWNTNTKVGPKILVRCI